MDSDDPYAIPDTKTLLRAGGLEILNEEGQKVPFNSLLTPSPHKPTQQRQQIHLIIFIRHFFCGHCEAYIRTISANLPLSLLSTASPPINLSIIGCGQPSTVPEYKARTSCPYPIYCDPERNLYRLLGMRCTLDLGKKKPEYIKSGLLAGSMSSMWTMLRSRNIWKGGAFEQNGGEWIFVDGEVRWCHRMRSTRDHAEVWEVRKALGLEVKEGEVKRDDE
ncbi:hypothetical protein M433DRAFT_73573 [Acidomyces richmondensis BFW]|nr:MAG: hypothetical protein FE78DRAFT_136533 [Acidomyces sp. 'richmondensis']KYG42522.1 hypothetical protein M433DRAFT_73573 [Acidomyces richmondensis BFW]